MTFYGSVLTSTENEVMIKRVGVNAAYEHMQTDK